MWIHIVYDRFTYIVFFLFFLIGRLLFRFLPNPITCGGRCFFFKIKLTFLSLAQLKLSVCIQKTMCASLGPGNYIWNVVTALSLETIEFRPCLIYIYLQPAIKLVNTPHGLILWVLSRYYSRYKLSNGLFIKLNR